MSAPMTPMLFDELIDLLTSTPSPAKILAYEPPEALQERLRDLLLRNQQTGLSDEERAELEEFLRLNRFISRLKLKARQKLTAV